MEKSIIETLKNGGVGVMPTDTLLGVVGSALSKRSVERIYKIRKRDKNKPLIVLISDKKDLKNFGIKDLPKELNLIWPGPVSVIFEVKNSKFKYLHRGSKTIAFRVPKNKKMLGFLKKVGPLVAPSANIQGKAPASNIMQAKAYFGPQVDFYVAGRVGKIASTILSFRGKLGFELIREGAMNKARLNRLKLVA